MHFVKENVGINLPGLPSCSSWLFVSSRPSFLSFLPFFLPALPYKETWKTELNWTTPPSDQSGCRMQVAAHNQMSRASLKLPVRNLRMVTCNCTTAYHTCRAITMAQVCDVSEVNREKIWMPWFTISTRGTYHWSNDCHVPLQAQTSTSCTQCM